MFKTMTPDALGDPRSVIFSRGAADGKWNGPEITEGVRVLIIARVKAVNICFITPQQTTMYLSSLTRKVHTLISDTHIHN